MHTPKTFATNIPADVLNALTGSTGTVMSVAAGVGLAMALFLVVSELRQPN